MITTDTTRPGANVEDRREQRHIASRTLGQLGFWVSAAYLAVTVLYVLLGDSLPVRAVTWIVWGMGWAACELLRRRGQIKRAAWALTYGGLALMATQQWWSGGMSSAFGGYALVVVVGGLMGGTSLAGWLTASVGAVLGFVWWAGARGWVPPPEILLTPAHLWIQQFSLAALSAACVAISIGRLREANKVSMGRAEQAQLMRDNFEALFERSAAPMGITHAAGPGVEAAKAGMGANAAFAELFRVEREPGAGDGAHAAFWRDPEDLAEILQALREGDKVDRYHARLVSADGARELACLVSAAPVSRDGVEAILWTFQDVTENERLRVQMQHLNADLEARVEGKARELDFARKELGRRESLARLGEMVAGVAHEINTPIGNALLAASTLEEPARRLGEMSAGGSVSRAEISKLAAKVRDASTLTVDNLGRAREVISSFKQLSADQAGQTRREFGLQEVLAGFLRAMAPAMKKSEARAELAVSERARGARLDGFPGALTQLATILADNALSHAFGDDPAARGRPAVFKVEVDLIDEGSARVVFSDNGPGVPRAIRGCVFEPFFTTKAGKGGTGLGLAIAWNLAQDALGGELRLGEVDGGCSFELIMPLVAPKVRDEAERGRR